MKAIADLVQTGRKMIVDFVFAAQPEPRKTAGDYIQTAAMQVISDPFAARNTMLECTQLFPANPDTWQMLGHCHLKAGEKSEGVKALEKAVDVAREQGLPVSQHESRLQAALASGPKGLSAGPA